MPLFTVQSKHSKGIMNVFSGGAYESPKRTFLPKKMNECSQEIKSELQFIHGIGLTTNSWASSASEHYTAYTSHYITKNWELKSKVLSTDHSEEKQTSEYLVQNMKTTEQKWGLENLLFLHIYVYDNAANISKAPKVMDIPRVGFGCLAHTINLAASPATSIEQVSKILLKVRTLVKAFKKRHPTAPILKKKQELLLPDNWHKLILKCPTRWNSFFL